MLSVHVDRHRSSGPPELELQRADGFAPYQSVYRPFQSGTRLFPKACQRIDSAPNDTLRRLLGQFDQCGVHRFDQTLPRERDDPVGRSLEERLVLPQILPRLGECSDDRPANPGDQNGGRQHGGGHGKAIVRRIEGQYRLGEAPRHIEPDEDPRIDAQEARQRHCAGGPEHQAHDEYQDAERRDAGSQDAAGEDRGPDQVHRQAHGIEDRRGRRIPSVDDQPEAGDHQEPEVGGEVERWLTDGRAPNDHPNPHAHAEEQYDVHDLGHAVRDRVTELGSSQDLRPAR